MWETLEKTNPAYGRDATPTRGAFNARPSHATDVRVPSCGGPSPPAVDTRHSGRHCSTQRDTPLTDYCAIALGAASKTAPLCVRVAWRPRHVATVAFTFKGALWASGIVLGNNAKSFRAFVMIRVKWMPGRTSVALLEASGSDTHIAILFQTEQSLYFLDEMIRLLKIKYY